jgi:hypothetical protein
MRNKLFLIFIVLFATHIADAQELNCKVKVMFSAIQNVDKQVFATMEKSISDFMNTRKWTNDEFGTNERIDVNMMINLTGKAGDEDLYFATLTLQAARPVYNTSYTSPIVNYLDKDLVFKYTQFNAMQFDENHIGGSDPLAANLPAVLAYYAYVILGLDYDSFSPKGGEELFKKAQNVVNNAPEQGKAIPGWKAIEGNKNRYWLVDQLLSPRFSDFRSYWYSMHRDGFDKMAQKPDEAKQKILEGIAKLNQLNKENPASMLLQFFFAAKSNELAKVVATAPKMQKPTYISQLSQMDVSNAAKYQLLNR